MDNSEGTLLGLGMAAFAMITETLKDRVLAGEGDAVLRIISASGMALERNALWQAEALRSARQQMESFEQLVRAVAQRASSGSVQ